MIDPREDLARRRDAVLGTARWVADKARDEGRELTAAEAADVDAAISEAKKHNESLAADSRHRHIMSQLDAMVSDSPNVLGGSGQHVALTGVCTLSAWPTGSSRRCRATRWARKRWRPVCRPRAL
jgi:hypothetical protein